jgi:WD40 repeat protein
LKRILFITIILCINIVPDFSEITFARSAHAEEILGGIGTHLADAIIYEIYDNSPAQLAGIRNMDKIIAVDGMDVTGKSDSDLILLMRGKEGSTVDIRVLRPGNDKPLDFSMIRRLVEKPLPNTPLIKINSAMHSSQVTDLATDASGKVLATSSLDKTIKIWEAATGKLFRTIHPPIGLGQDGILNAVAVSPDGKYLAAGGSARVIYIFNIQSGEMTAAIDLPSDVRRLAYSPDGSRLAVGTLLGFSVFSTADMKIVLQDYSFKSTCLGLDFDRNGNLVVGSSIGILKRYRPDGTLIYELKTDYKTLQNIKFSPDGSQFAISYAHSSPLEVRNALDGALRFTLSGNGLISVAWSLDGKYLMAAGWPNAMDSRKVIKKWSATSRNIDENMELPTNKVISKILTLNNSMIAYVAGEGGLGLITGGGAQDASNVARMNSLSFFHSIECADFKKNHDKFKISADSSGVLFSYEQYGQAMAFFDLKNRRLLKDDLPNQNLISSRRTANGIDIKNWDNYEDRVDFPQPSLNGIKLEGSGNTSHKSLAVRHNGEGFILGSRTNLRYYSREGKLQWTRRVSSTAWDTVISANDNMFVVAHADSTIRWYRLKDGEELYSLYLHSDRKRWVLWTPEGFFDHSTGGEELIGWHLNQRKDKESQFLPVSKMYKDFYRPDLVQASYEGKDLSAYAKAIDINQFLSHETFPPIIRFLTKSGDSDNNNIPIRAKVCDTGGGIGDVTLFLNGMPVAVETNGRGLKVIEKNSKDQCFTFERTITLSPGANIIQLMAYNKPNTIESDRDTVEINHTAKAAQPELHVLTVAVNAYRDSELRLKYTLPDADAIAEQVQQKGKELFNKVHIHTLRDGDVTKEGMMQTFARIGSKMKREDVFILFVAGHGITDEKEGAYYFLPVDFRYTDESAIKKQGVSMTDFRNMLTNVQAMKSLILLDTCNSGSFAEAIISRGLTEKTAITKLSRAVGRATIVASSRNQAALEGFNGHGAFTWAILEGMKGKAADQGGKITISTLSAFIEEELPKLTFKKWGYEQIPQKTLQGMDFQIGTR